MYLLYVIRVPLYKTPAQNHVLLTPSPPPCLCRQIILFEKINFFAKVWTSESEEPPPPNCGHLLRTDKEFGPWGTFKYHMTLREGVCSNRQSAVMV